MTMPREASH